ncbi:hypothetical protein D3C76_1273250 [compost metagenome]
MRQHSAFGHAGSPTGILQERQIGVDNIGFNILLATPALERTAKRNGSRQMVFRHQPLDVFDDEVNQRAFGGGELIAHTRQDHMLDLGVEHHFFQRMSKVGDDHNGTCATVVQLMFQFTWRIQRVNVHHHHTRT